MNDMTLNISGEFDKKDIILVAVAEGEKRLREELAACRKQIDVMQAEVVILDKQYQNLVQDAGKAIVTEICPNLNRFSEIVTSLSVGELEMYVSSKQVFNSLSIRVIISKAGSIGDYYQEKLLVLFSKKVDLPKQVAKAHELLQAKKEKVEELTTYAISLRKKLADIPSFERQITAKVVRAELEKTTDGRALLEKMLGDFEESLKLLGA